MISKTNIKTKLFTISIFIFLCFSGCKKHCPAFPEKYWLWLPYSSNQQLSFISGTDTANITIDDFYIPVEVSYSLRCDCDCDYIMYFETSELKDFQIYFAGEIDMTVINLDDVPQIEIELESKKYLFNDEYGSYYDSLNIGGTLYRDVVALEKSGDTSKIIIAKNYGILQFTAGGKNWLLNLEE